MIITLQRLQSYPDFSLGTLHVDGVLYSFTLEDEQREVKIMGETRIPAGIYPIVLRKAGRIHESYLKKYSFHKGMLHIIDIPNFSYVYFHIGNNDDDTAGCPLVANSCTVGRNFIEDSTINYEMFYKKVLSALDIGESVYLVVKNEA